MTEPLAQLKQETAHAVGVNTFKNLLGLSPQLVAPSGMKASAFRAGLKTFFRGGVGRNWRPPNLAGKTDAELRISAGKTNFGMNVYGAGIDAAGGISEMKCGCSN